jgi:hypothetical protein
LIFLKKIFSNLVIPSHAENHLKNIKKKKLKNDKINYQEINQSTLEKNNCQKQLNKLCLFFHYYLPKQINVKTTNRVKFFVKVISLRYSAPFLWQYLRHKIPAFLPKFLIN